MKYLFSLAITIIFGVATNVEGMLREKEQYPQIFTNGKLVDAVAHQHENKEIDMAQSIICQGLIPTLHRYKRNAYYGDENT
jgi:hypothetical protein